MRGALDGSKAVAAPTTAQLEKAVAAVAAAAVTTGAAETAEQPAPAAAPSPAAAVVPAAVPAAHHAQLIAAGDVQSTPGPTGLKALVPRATAHAEAAT